MRPRDYVPLVFLAGIAGFIVVQGTKNKRDIPRTRRATPVEKETRAQPRTAADSTTLATGDTLQADVSSLADARGPGPTKPPRDLASIQEKIKDGSPGTYLLDIIAEQNDLLMRWPDRRMDAVRVWIDRDPRIPDFQVTYPVVAERVFDEWHEAGFPLRFDFVADSTKADLTIRWTTVLPASDKPRIGVTTKQRDDDGWIVSAEILISTHDKDSGQPLTPELVAGIARHEIGHALGLGHSKSSGDVMYPESKTSSISRADRATLHLLYILPPGPVK